MIKRRARCSFLDSLGWRDIFHLGGVWDRAKRIFTEPIDRLIDFGKGLVAGIIELHQGRDPACRSRSSPRARAAGTC